MANLLLVIEAARNGRLTDGHYPHADSRWKASHSTFDALQDCPVRNDTVVGQRLVSSAPLIWIIDYLSAQDDALCVHRNKLWLHFEHLIDRPSNSWPNIRPNHRRIDRCQQPKLPMDRILPH